MHIELGVDDSDDFVVATVEEHQLISLMPATDCLPHHQT